MCLAYLLVTLDTPYAEPSRPPVEPILVSLIEKPLRPPAPLAPIALNPTLAKIQISLPREAPDYPIQMPVEPASNAAPSTPVAGPSEIGASVDRAGGEPATLAVTHYVAPRYPDLAARFGEHGEVAMALRVDAQGNVDQVEIMRSTGSSRLDRAAVSAARQWKFAPATDAVHREPIWAQVKLLFAPPQRLLGVPFIVMPYSAVAHKIEAEIRGNRKTHAPSAELSVRRSIETLIDAFPVAQGNDSVTNVGASLEAEVGLLGPIHTLEFLGFVDRGIALDRSESWAAQGPPQSGRAHWEAYDVEQSRGSSVWLVEATASGAIQRIEVALR